MNAEAEMATADGLGAEAPSADDVQAMREWIADSGIVYGELDYQHALDLLSDTPDQQIISFIDKRYDGGVGAFLWGGEAV